LRDGTHAEHQRTIVNIETSGARLSLQRAEVIAARARARWMCSEPMREQIFVSRLLTL
jgi:hypothetical protein